MDPTAIFLQRQEHFKSAIKRINQQLDRIALVRLGTFILAGLGVWWATSWEGVWWMLFLLLGFVAFGWVVRWNNHVRHTLRYQEALLRINVDEQDRLDGKLNGFDQGQEFADPQHPYSSDLDLFGKHSLFQLVSRAETVLGKRKLALWLLEGVGHEVVALRQQAVQALAADIDWRQNFQATGLLDRGDVAALERLSNWLQGPSLSAHRPWMRWLPWVMIVLNAITLIAWAIGVSGWEAASIVIGISFIITRTQSKAIAKIATTSEERSKLLSAWSQLIAHAEQVPDSGSLVAQVTARLAKAGQPASSEIAKLGSIAGNLDPSRLGFLHPFINALFFWDILHVVALERWRDRLRDKLMDWFDAIAELEALSSLAAVHFAQPEWTFPELVTGPFQLVAQDLGHPLIPGAKRVSNPVSIEGNGQVWLVTGSNMSGKSTYLRTLGINIALALAGAPVCAHSLRLSPMRVITSMRTLDNLEESTSSFYAELKRLQAVLALVRQGGNVFFLLDEILKGTNSRDRHAGARALVEQLHRLGGSGLVSTHDIELVDMAIHLPGAIHNYSFNCTVRPDGALEFDYRLTPGQCLSMNATALMRAMGIEV